MADIGNQKYVSLTTYTKDGRAKAAPVWITGSGGTYGFTTGHAAWKTKRLRNNPNVLAQPCDLRGRVVPGAPTYSGTGSVKTDPISIASVEKLLASKYGIFFRAIQLSDFVKAKIGRGSKQDTVVIELVLAPEST